MSELHPVIRDIGMHPCIPGHVLTTFASFKISNTYFKDMAGDFLGYFFLDKRPIYNYSGKFVIYYLKM